MFRFALPLVLALATPAHALTIYDDRAQWEAAVSGSLYTETFDSVPDQYVPNSVGGTMYTPGFDIVIPTGWVLHTSIENGAFHGDAEGDLPITLPSFPNGLAGWNDILFHTPLTALGFDVSIEMNSYFDATLNGETVRVASSTTGDHIPRWFFFGLISDAPFSDVRINGNLKFYQLDNVSCVPEPTVWALLLLFCATLIRIEFGKLYAAAGNTDSSSSGTP